jgi:iron(III) transport system permease protein
LKGVHNLLATALCSVPVLVGFAAPFTYLINASARRLHSPGTLARLATEAGNTLLLATTATFVILLLGAVTAYTIRIWPQRMVLMAHRIATMGYALPGTVVAIGVLIPVAALDRMIDGSMRSLFGWSTGLLLIGSGTALIYAYTVRFLAISGGTIETGLLRIPRSLDFASRSLGQTSTQTLKRVLLPLSKPAIAAAALLVFVDCVKELPATLMLRPLNFETFATHLYAEAARGTYEDGAIAALSIVLIGLLPVLALSALGRKQLIGTTR